MKTPKHLATAMAVAMVATSVAPVMAATTTSNEEIIGKNRTETAVKISQDGWKKAETVILVNDSAIPDALTATPLAYAKNAPILLTGKDGLSKETADEIKRLAAKDVIMIGGDAVLTSKVEEGLKALKLKVDRIKGSTREETALAIAKRLDGIKDVSEIAVVNGVTGLADAVSVAAAAAEKGMPILLANPKSGLTLVEKFIKDESIKSSFIIGGDKVVSNEIAKNLPGKQRIEGANRNETNAKVIEKFYADRELDNLYVAKDGMENSGHLIDALAVGSLAAKNGAPVLIASKKLNEKQINVINTKRVDTITQVGGNGNEKAFSELKEIEKETVYKVKNEAELQEALKRADANDIIELESSATISNDVSIKTDNAVDVVLKGDCTGTVTVETPNANIENSGSIGTLVVENGKNTTVTNTSGGKIDKVEVSSSSENVKVENKGTITQVENNATGTTIENNGTISKPVTGTEKPSVEGNKPGGSTSGGGGGSVIVDGPEVARVSTEEELKAALENEEKTTIKLNNNITIKNRIHVKKSITIDLNNYELKCTELLNTEGNHSDGNPITDKNPKWGYAILITKDREGGENSQINVNVINGNLKFGASQEKQLNVGIGILGSNVDLTVSDVNVDMGGFTYKNAPDVAFGSMYGIATNGTYKNIKIDVKNGTKINNTILGMYLPSDKTDVTLTNTEINAGTGISIKGGILNIIDSKITATDDYGAPGAIDDYINGLKENNSGSEAAGEAIYLEGNYHWDAIVNISGNSELESKHGYALRTHFLREQATSGEHSGEALKKEININGATVKAGKDKVIFKNHKTYESFPNDAINSLNSIKITAGKYTDDVTKYLESGYKCTELNGMYTVVEDDAVSTIK